MPKFHWTDEFPYLVPVWKSAHQYLGLDTEVDYDPNIPIDFGGIGMYGEIYHRKNRRLTYQLYRPTLPFYIYEKRIKNKLASWNSLALLNAQDENSTLYSYFDGKLRGIELNIDAERFQTLNPHEFNCDHYHHLNSNHVTNVLPLAFHAEDCWEIEIFERNPNGHVLDISLFKNNQLIQLMAHSRDSLKIYRCDDEQTYERLCLIIEINQSNKLFPQNDSELDYWDRNFELPESFLVSFIDNHQLFHWNVDQCKSSTIKNFKNPEESDNRFNTIGIQWANEFNPFLYYYSTHNELSMGDIRVNSTDHTPISIKADDFFYVHKDMELFQSFIQNPMDLHQLIVSSDFNVNFLDIRYPKRSVRNINVYYIFLLTNYDLFQIFNCKHMLTTLMANRMNSTLLNLNGKQKLLLSISNSQRLCLLTFENGPSFQPIMEHYPFYINLPKNTSKFEPILNADDSYITGFQILPGKYTIDLTHDSNFFTTAIMINNGDIYFQDFWPTENEQEQLDNERSKSENFYGDPNIFASNFDKPTENYVQSIKEYVTNLSIENNDQNIQEFNLHEIEDELNLLNEEEDDDQDKIKLGTGLKINDGTIQWVDNDPIDFDLFRNNWENVPGSSEPNQGLRNIVNKLTASICDEWFKKLDKQKE
ncbi:hypothetical protein BLOT_012206 [Blomia tropicalis]|nr:hypothetical protein BLOT_012206 [Blomia tropicalis]